MAPRLKILMASGSKVGIQIYFLFSQKSRQTNPLQVPQQGPYWETAFICCTISQKSADLIYFAAEAWTLKSSLIVIFMAILKSLETL